MFRRIMLAVTLMFCFVPAVQAQKFSVSGFVNYQDLGKGSDLGWTRLFPTITFGDKLVVMAEVEFAQMDDDNVEKVEWLNQANISYKMSPTTTVMIGRSFRAFGYITPAPFLVRTAEYPGGYPFSGFYAYGIRMDKEREIGLGTLSFKGDAVLRPEGFRTITTNKPEISFYAGWNIPKVGTTVAVAGQFSSDHRRFGLGVNTNPSSRLSVYYAAFKDSWEEGDFGTFYAESHFGSFHPHAQCSASPDRENCVVGVALVHSVGGREFKFIGDYMGHGFMWRTQVRF